jgi:RNA polymerase sigma-70 factor (ECF subfamily)
MNSLPQAEPSELSDAEYVISSRNGCPDHFRFLVERYQRPLFAFLARRLGERSDAEEAAQESFVRAFLSLAKLNKPASFFPWLLGIAVRVSKEQARMQQRGEQEREFAESLSPQSGSDPCEDGLEEAIAALPESYRQVLLLRYYEGLSCQEVASRLAMPLGSVTKTLSRAYALLRQQLQGDHRNPVAEAPTFSIRQPVSKTGPLPGTLNPCSLS